MNNNVVFTNTVEQELKCQLNKISFSKLFVIVDENSKHKCLPLIIGALPDYELIETKSGEENKTIIQATEIWSILSEKSADRKSLVINLGGGLLSDLGGFSASCFKRGLQFINIPTTLLSQVDASVGGKTGVNLNNLKNEIGVFNTPEVVIIDSVFLKTLEKIEFISGIGEMLKHGLIREKAHLDKIIKLDLNEIDYVGLLDLIKESVKIKTHFVENDFTETSIRKVLNFAHTIGHAFETFSHNKNLGLKHGELVAHGIIAELLLSNKMFSFDIKIISNLIEFIYKTFSPFSYAEDDIDEIISYMLHDKKNENGRINFTLLEDIGKFKIDCYISSKDIKEVLKDYLKTQ